ncbi:MAG TPA: TonB-dependent receptor, partial [Flavitalea sp.]|nr:TonB-dependent receptor [Flavitalea sp.]
IEVLRDGASAQYGSDAIAGVINIQLNNSIDKFRMQVHTGQTYKGDGETVNVGINHGTAFLKKGFLNFSGAYRFQNPTSRGGEYKGTVYVADTAADDAIVKSRNFNRKQVSNAGSSKQESYSLSTNGGYTFNTKTELFWTAIFNHRRTAFTSGYTLPKNASRVNVELFPDGFKSQPVNSVDDVTGIMGIRGETKNYWRWEFSSTYGNNSARYYNEQTNNASQYFLLGKNAPTSFHTGSLLYGQLTNNAQFSKALHVTTNKLVNLALGAEWRFEHYNIRQGEEGSWHTYDNPLKKSGGSGGLVLSPDDAVAANRHVAATYADAEFEVNKRLLMGTALRFEYYNDFGSSISGKITARYKFNEKILVRSSVNNGFRAPSLQQRYYSHTRSTPSNSGGRSNLVNSGIFRNNSKVAKALGISTLEPERSLNVGGGFTTSVHPNIKLTVDGYWIQIKNRIVLSGVFDRLTNKNVGELLGNITDVSQLQLFTNAINTKTKGLDVAFHGSWRMRKTNLTAMLGANFTQTRLFGDIQKAGNLKSDSLNVSTLFHNEEKTRIEKGQPSNKVILLLTYQIAKTEIRIQNTRFGRTAIAPGLLYQTFSSKILTDISVAYSLRNWITVSLGANNVFSVYPDRLNDYRNTSEGMHIYSMEASPFGFNGGYYFISMTLCLK